MLKMRLIMMAMAILIFGAASIAGANGMLAWAPPENPVYETVDCTSAGTWDMSGDIPRWDRDPAYSEWDYTNNGGTVEQLTNACPAGSDDPIINQNIMNRTLESWTDWHVRIYHGTNLRDILVQNISTGAAAWTVETNSGNDYVGFFAHVETTGSPTNPQAVDLFEVLQVDFTYDAAGTGEVYIEQYPTTWYPIPEPSSIAALATGIGMFGIGAVRRRRQ